MNLDEIFGDTFIKLNTMWLSVVRTVVPTIVGAVLGFFANAGIDVPEEHTASLSTILFIVLTSAWYILARTLELQGTKRDIAWLAKLGGYMLGVPRTPEYIVPNPSEPEERESHIDQDVERSYSETAE